MYNLLEQYFRHNDTLSLDAYQFLKQQFDVTPLPRQTTLILEASFLTQPDKILSKDVVMPILTGKQNPSTPTPSDNEELSSTQTLTKAPSVTFDIDSEWFYNRFNEVQQHLNIKHHKMRDLLCNTVGMKPSTYYQMRSNLNRFGKISTVYNFKDAFDDLYNNPKLQNKNKPNKKERAQVIIETSQLCRKIDKLKQKYNLKISHLVKELCDFDPEVMKESSMFDLLKRINEEKHLTIKKNKLDVLNAFIDTYDDRQIQQLPSLEKTYNSRPSQLVNVTNQVDQPFINDDTSLLIVVDDNVYYKTLNTSTEQPIYTNELDDARIFQRHNIEYAFELTKELFQNPQIYMLIQLDTDK